MLKSTFDAIFSNSKTAILKKSGENRQIGAFDQFFKIIWTIFSINDYLYPPLTSQEA